jgi:hypothetical protein
MTAFAFCRVKQAPRGVTAIATTATLSVAKVKRAIAASNWCSSKAHSPTIKRAQGALSDFDAQQHDRAV